MIWVPKRQPADLVGRSSCNTTLSQVASGTAVAGTRKVEVLVRMATSRWAPLRQPEEARTFVPDHHPRAGHRGHRRRTRPGELL